MPVSLLLRGPGAGETEAAAAAVFDELRTVEAVFSTYRGDSELCRVRRGELSLADCVPEVRAVAALCEQARVRTGGAFDATGPDGLWDPSGLVKGWAAERAARHLAVLPGLDWCLNAGGDVVFDSHSGDTFGIGIQDPTDPRAVIAVLFRRTGAVATSGTAARGRHLWDPRTGCPADTAASVPAASVPVVSVSVVGPSLLCADVWATACFVLADLAPLPPGYDGLLIHQDGSAVSTPGWDAQVG